MSVTSSEPSALRQLAAARVRNALPGELLDLADAAIEQAVADGDTVALELIVAELDSAAAAHPENGNGLRVAAARARAAFPSPPPAPSPAPESVQPVAAESTRYASWGSRLLAWLIDWCSLLVASLLTGALLGDTTGLVIWTLGAFAYFAYLNGRGRTLGKQLLRIEVVDASTGAPIGAARAAVRELVRLTLTVFTLGIGLIVDGLRPLWNQSHQTWHDSAVGSIVVHR